MMLPRTVIYVTLGSLLLLCVKTYNVQKCCPLGYNLFIEATTFILTCVPDLQGKKNFTDLAWLPISHQINGSSLVEMSEMEIADMKAELSRDILYGFPLCKKWDGSPQWPVTLPDYFFEISYNFVLIFGKNSSESGVHLLLDGVGTTQMPWEIGDRNQSWLIPFSGICFEQFEEQHVAFYCETEDMPFIRKCCPARYVYNTTSKTCSSVEEYPTIPDWHPHGRSKLGRHYMLYNMTPICESKQHGILNSLDREKRCKGFPSLDTTFLSTGELKEKNTIYNPHEYCGEKLWYEGNILFDNIVVCGTAPSADAKSTVYGAIFIIGGCCLLLTVIVSLWLPELHQTLGNWIALTHNATLMVAYFIWGSVKLTETLTTSQCTVLILMIQFSFLGSLFWLNAMCIDMSSTFRTTRLVSRVSWKRYMIYSAYAWGLTSLISIITGTMEFADNPLFGLPRPGFSCYCDFARETISILLYFYGPMAILLIFNSVLYGFTAWKIMRILRQTAILHKNDSNASRSSPLQSDRQRLIVYTKLFLLMGITWMTEIIGWAVSGKGGFWVLLDVINLLRAALIFILFVCKRPVLKSIQVRLRLIIGRLHRTSSNGTDVTAEASRKGDLRHGGESCEEPESFHLEDFERLSK